MTLQAAFRTARSALAANAFQTATVSRNISGADANGYARKIVLVEPSLSGTTKATRIMRATDQSLQSAALDASSVASGDEAVSKALDALQSIVGQASDGVSPSAMLSAFRTALLHAAAAPQDAAGLAAAVSRAGSLVASLNQASASIQEVRAQADQDMASSVSTINALLKSFDQTNHAAISGSASGQDVSDLLDRRDAILSDLAKEVSISTIIGSNGDMSIYTDSGVALYQGTPRAVSMEPTTTFAAGVTGNAVYIDGVAVTGPSATMASRGGKVSGLAQIRDTYTTMLQSQIDEVAVGLINAFSQQSAAGSVRSGLFTWSGGPSMPASGTQGVAASIGVDPSAQGNPAFLRDGGIGGDPNFVANATGSSSYSARLYDLLVSLDAQQSFSAPPLPAHLNVSDLAAQSQGWLEGARQTAADKSISANAILVQTNTALTNSSGVNIDDQMSKMLDLENSYQASAKMMAMVDSMYAALFSAVK